MLGKFSSVNTCLKVHEKTLHVSSSSVVVSVSLSVYMCLAFVACSDENANVCCAFAEFGISFKIQVNHCKVALNDKSILN